MPLAINRQIALAPGEYHRPARRRLTQKHQPCQRRNCLNYNVVTRALCAFLYTSSYIRQGVAI